MDATSRPAFSENEAETMKKLIKPVGISLLVFIIAFRPEPAAQAVLRVVGVIGDIANGIGQFVTTLFQ
jgi:hypothetical protein